MNPLDSVRQFLTKLFGTTKINISNSAGSQVSAQNNDGWTNHPEVKAVYDPEMTKQAIGYDPYATSQVKEVRKVSPVQAPTQSGAIARNPAYKNYTIAPAVIDSITRAANQFGVPPQLLFDIALQESSFNPGLVNRTPAGRAAGNPTGLFQFTEGTWSGLNNPSSGAYGQGFRQAIQNPVITDPYANAAAAAYLISNGQLDRWADSESVWGNYWTPQELEGLGFYDQSPTHKKGKRYSVDGFNR